MADLGALQLLQEGVPEALEPREGLVVAHRQRVAGDDAVRAVARAHDG